MPPCSTCALLRWGLVLFAIFRYTLFTLLAPVAAFVSVTTFTRFFARFGWPPRYPGGFLGRCHATGEPGDIFLRVWVQCVIGQASRPRPVRVTTVPLGTALLLGGVSINPFSFCISRLEDNFTLLVMGVLCFGMGGQLVWVGLSTAPLQQRTALHRHAQALFLVVRV
jgi:hypothetical protein